MRRVNFLINIILLSVFFIVFTTASFVVAENSTPDQNVISEITDIYEAEKINARTGDEKVYTQSMVDEMVNQSIVLKRINNERLYVILLVLLSIVSIIVVLFFMRQHTHDAKDVVNAAGLCLIITGTIILVLVVDTSEQLTAAIGVMGAIAGYLFRSAIEQKQQRGEQ